MRAERNMTVLVDAAVPLELVDEHLASVRAWSGDAVSIAIVLFGQRAGWAPASGALAGSAVARGIRKAPRPALGDALELARERRPHAIVTLLASEPTDGWVERLVALDVPILACVTMAREPPAAIGSGRLGALFRGEHLGVALRWVVRELVDRTWACACGAVRIYPGDIGAACASCNAPSDVPPRLRVGRHVVLLVPGARLYPHHVGAELAFDRVVAELDGVPRRDGEIAFGGVTAQIRTSAPSSIERKSSLRFRPTPLRALGDRCDGCEGPLLAPFGHAPPDPRRFCARCLASESRCDFCATPVGERGNVWPDGRKACRDCWTTAMTRAEDLDELTAMARAWMKKRLGMEMPDCPIRFEHAAAIAHMHGRTFTAVKGFNARPIGFFRKPIDAPAGLFIEHPMPRSIAYGVVTHELTHLWQWHNWPRELALTLTEGLAMWVEYQALLDAGAIHAARDAERYGDPVYGLGFRVALAVEKDVGFDRVKDQMQHVAALRA
jgi:hypothetical protein